MLRLPLDTDRSLTAPGYPPTDAQLEELAELARMAWDWQSFVKIHELLDCRRANAVLRAIDQQRVQAGAA